MRTAVILLATVLVLGLAPAHAGEPEPNPVEVWLFQLAMAAAPPATAWRPPAGPHADETPAQREARYRAIARDIYLVAFNARNKPIAGFSRLTTAGILLGMAVGESSLAPDADLGPCYRGGAYRTRCDSGQAVGILQVQMHPRSQPPFWADRRKLLRAGLAGLRGSFGACRDLPVAERLAAYGAGTCRSAAGRKASRKRWALIQRVMAAAAPPAGTDGLVYQPEDRPSGSS